MSSLQERFYKLVCMGPTLGLYFHGPNGYPEGKAQSWRRDGSFLSSADAAWRLVIAAAGDVQYRNYSVVSPLGEQPTYGEIAPAQRDGRWPITMAIVVSISNHEITAVYRDPEPPADAPSPYCLIRLSSRIAVTIRAALQNVANEHVNVAWRVDKLLQDEQGAGELVNDLCEQLEVSPALTSVMVNRSLSLVLTSASGNGRIDTSAASQYLIDLSLKEFTNLLAAHLKQSA